MTLALNLVTAGPPLDGLRVEQRTVDQRCWSETRRTRLSQAQDYSISEVTIEIRPRRPRTRRANTKDSEGVN